MRVDNLAQAAEVFEGSTLLADEELCLNLRGRTLLCEACGEHCAVDALTLSADAIEVDEASCTRCGACIPACPTGVMRLTGFVPERFLQALGGAQEVHLHCSASADGGGGVVIPCHQMLDARLLAAALADGTQRFVLHGLSGCGQCPKGNAVEHVRDVDAILREWFGARAPQLEQAQPGEHRVAGTCRHEDQVHVSRRSFLRLAGARAVTGAAAWLLPVAEEEEAAEDPPFYQAVGEIQRPVAYQAMLAARVTQLPWVTGCPRPWRRRTLADECSACLVCAQRCPTGALQAAEDEEGRTISFQTALCTDCGLCEQLCPERAVRPQPVLNVNEITAPRTLLMHRAMYRCSGCGNPFLPTTPRAELCHVCQNEQELDDEWLAMLEG